MQTSAQMRQLIETWEGCRLDPYQDSVGVWTVGYGHTGSDVDGGSGSITQQQADDLLAEDLQRFESAVAELCPETSQQQFDALVSFSYNLGSGALRGSTLRTLHNEGNYPAAAGEFAKWNHAGGQVLAGLTRRRQGESQVYATGLYADVTSPTLTASEPETDAARPTLASGMTGDAVAELQTKLGIDPADGIFGPHTKAVVIQFQQNNRLAPDGVVGPMTWAKLDA